MSLDRDGDETRLEDDRGAGAYGEEVDFLSS